jgi:hypothetical protein
MGVAQVSRTMPGGYTPICEECGIYLCWDISFEEYAENEAFLDAWVCEHCNGDVRLHPPMKAIA